VGLRVLALLCVVLALLRPVLILEADESTRPRVFLLLDNSGSMKLPYAPSSASDSGFSRMDVAVGAARSLLEILPSKYETSIFSFTDSLRELDAALQEGLSEKGGARSALGSALEELASRAGAKPAAAVLISDGSSSFGPDPSGVAKRLRFPVYTVTAAREGALRDIEITDVLCPASGYAGTEVPVFVRVKGHGLENLDTPVNISEEGTIVSRGLLKLAGSAETQVSLSVKPRSGGLHFYRVSIPPVGGEISDVNNAVSFPLRVLSERLRVLYLQGDLSWDFTFVKRHLESDPRLEATFSLISDRKAALPAAGPFSTASSADIEQSSVVVLGDGAIGRIGVETWRDLEDFVSSGGGLLIIGADGLSEIPAVARNVLPAHVREHRLWGSKQNLSCELTFEGLRHAICDVERDASSIAESWKDVSPLVGSHSLEKAKEGSAILIEAKGGEERFPVVVAGSYGRGRVMLVAASGIWRWGFTLPAVGGSERLFDRFVSNSIWWLSSSEEESLREVRPTSWVFQNGEEVMFVARGEGHGQRLDLKVTDETGKLLVPALTEPSGADTVKVSFGTLGPGTYDYSASFGQEERSPGSEGRFVVDDAGPEYRSLFPDPGLLAYVSEASGGKFFRADEVDELAREIETFGERAAVVRQIRLWNHPLLLAIFATSIALEWWLRRRSGLP